MNKFRAWVFRGWNGDCTRCETPINHSGRWCDRHDPSLVEIELDPTQENRELIQRAEAHAQAEGVALSVLLHRVIDEMIKESDGRSNQD